MSASSCIGRWRFMILHGSAPDRQSMGMAYKATRLMIVGAQTRCVGGRVQWTPEVAPESDQPREANKYEVMDRDKKSKYLNQTIYFAIEVSYRIAPNFCGTIFLWISWWDIQSRKFFSRKFRTDCSVRGFTMHNHKTFIKKFLDNDNFWTMKIWSYKVLPHPCIHHLKLTKQCSHKICWEHLSHYLLGTDTDKLAQGMQHIQAL